MPIGFTVENFRPFPGERLPGMAAAFSSGVCPAFTASSPARSGVTALRENTIRLKTVCRPARSLPNRAEQQMLTGSG
jgi:hypothetical protein